MKQESGPSRLKRVTLSALFITGIIALLLIFLFRENLGKIIAALQNADYALVAFAIGIYLFALLIWSARWRISLKTLGYPLPIHKIYATILSGIFITNITPLTYAGGDPIARSYLSKKVLGVPYSVGFATIIVELLIDLPIFFSLLMIALALSVNELWAAVLIIAGWLVLLELIASALYHLVNRKVGATGLERLAIKIFKGLKRKVRRKPIKEWIGAFYLGCDSILGNFRVSSKLVVLSFFLWAFGMIRLLFVFLALGHFPPLTMLMLAVTLPSIVGLIPLLPGGIGTVDAALASIFLFFGMPLEVAISATLIDRGITLVFGTLLGASVLSSLGLKRMLSTHR
ncbi:MAG: flippase-like domain-containing protein [Candidatus Hadarchaeales archaeon]